MAGLAALLGLAGCDKGGDSDSTDKAATDKAGAAVDKVVKAVEKGKELTKEGTELSPEQYEKMMLALAACKINGRRIDKKCPELIALRTARKGRKALASDMLARFSAVGRKHIAHDSEAVRLYAASTLKSVLGAQKETLATVLEHAPTEKSPAVLRAMLDSVGSKMKVNPDVAKLVFALADSDAPMVRTEAVSWLTSSFSDGVDGTMKKALEIANKDPDVKVRGYACSRLGKKVDEAVLPTLSKLTSDKIASSEPKLYRSCMEGLLDMFAQFPFNEQTSQKGYDLFVKRLSIKKCTKDAPPWALFSRMSWIAKKRADYDNKTPWFSKRSGKLMKALESVVTCEEANWMARKPAVELLAALGADKKTLEKLHKKVTGSNAKNRTHVIKALDAAIKAAK